MSVTPNNIGQPTWLRIRPSNKEYDLLTSELEHANCNVRSEHATGTDSLISLGALN